MNPWSAISLDTLLLRQLTSLGKLLKLNEGGRVVSKVLACDFEVFVLFLVSVVGVVHRLEKYSLYLLGVEIPDDLVL